MITIDGEPVPTRDDSDLNNLIASHREQLRAMRAELKLLRALAALNPPYELAKPLHARIAHLLRDLTTDREEIDACPPASLTDDDLRQALTITRAIRDLPAPARPTQTETSIRNALGGYALDLITETERRNSHQPDHLTQYQQPCFRIN